MFSVLRLSGVSSTLMSTMCSQLSCHVATFLFFFQRRVSLHAVGDSLLVTLLNSIVFLTSVLFTSVVARVDVLSVVRSYVDCSIHAAIGTSCVYIAHMLNKDKV